MPPLWRFVRGLLPLSLLLFACIICVVLLASRYLGAVAIKPYTRLQQDITTAMQEGSRIPLASQGAETRQTAEAFNILLENLQAYIQRSQMETARIETILTGMHEGILMLDERHRILLCNPAALAFLAIAPALKMNTYNKGKYLLRRAFSGGYLPEHILQREKAAFSDAVGHSMVDILKAHAESTIRDKAFQARRARYSHAQPFTKESLLYRELFEKHYPGQSSMIADFWMPNKEWEGCDVDDPSARVLANYGASGM